MLSNCRQYPNEQKNRMVTKPRDLRGEVGNWGEGRVESRVGLVPFSGHISDSNV